MFKSSQLSQSILKLIFVFTAVFLIACDKNSNQQKIGIVVPLEHKALNEIITGFVDTLKKESNLQVEFKIANAQNDLNLQRAIIQQMQDNNYNMIVPIGSATTEMTLAMVKTIPVVSIASSYSEEERQKQLTCHTAIVHDDIPPEATIRFIHQAYPHISHLTLIHSTLEKIFPDVKKAIAAGKQNGITIKPLMVSSLSELYTITSALPQNTQGIFVLRDNLIVSGINTLAIKAKELKIPLITSDQGSVQQGAAFALGVHERDIGIAGATLASAILAGKTPCSLPIHEMQNLTLFINPDALQQQNQSSDIIQQTAKKLHYKIELTQSERKT